MSRVFGPITFPVVFAAKANRVAFLEQMRLASFAISDLLVEDDAGLHVNATALRELAEERQFCCAHVVAADYNLDDTSLEWVIAEGGPEARYADPAHPLPAGAACEACAALCYTLLAFPERERYVLLDALSYWEDRLARGEG